MSGYDRALVEAAIRNGADITAAEAGALLADRDALAVARDQLGVAHDRAVDDLERLERRVARARAIMGEFVADDSVDVEATLYRVTSALDGEIR